ncbi:S8 family serine peptidase, partial [Candidatus Woesebacteria bacterium]|nr:S8 family serine peptidase [Candidatus Woesebacteria bacterium]
LSLGLMGRGFNAAVEQLVEDGFTVVAAAGNDFNDVAQYTPASADGVIAVGGAAWYGGPNPLGFYVNSNYGEEIDLLAPAFRIVSASHLNEHGEATMSGTSMAAPAVSGAAAQLIELHPGILPAQVEKYLTDTSLHIVPFVPENTTNGLLQVNTQGTGVEIDNALRETETLTYHTHISSTEGLQIETTFSESVVVESGAVITDTVPTTTTNGTFFCNNEQTSCIYVSPPGELPTEDVSMTVSQERTSGIQVDTTWSDLNRQPLEEQMDIVNFRSEVLLPLITR